MRVQIFLKKAFDFVGGLLGLMITTPLLLIVAILIKLDSRGPVFFRQKRVGRKGRIFEIWKFRTMVENAESIGAGSKIYKNDSRITMVGKFIRRFGVDELPQLINVIKGDMSFVGPRAALPHQVEKYNKFERQRLQIKPGITNINVAMKGWNALPWRERIKWDVWYIDNWSLWLDFKILFKTPLAVLSGSGQYGEKGIVEDYE
jgi:lipopolysaccharide/colanic/teichoic acid biosynthesis glycosyltransferase